jgi:hypothetical protein
MHFDVSLKCLSSRLSHRVVLITGAAADADGSDHFAFALERNASREDHNFSVIRGVDSEKLSARL